jgi:hypothetical protein
MSYNVPALEDGIQVSVDLVPWGLMRRRENIAFLRITAIPESRGGGFMVEGFDTASPMGSVLRTARIAPHGRNQAIWTWIADAAYALSHAKPD